VFVNVSGKVYFLAKMESWLPSSEFVLEPLLLVCGKDSRQNKYIRGEI